MNGMRGLFCPDSNLIEATQYCIKPGACSEINHTFLRRSRVFFSLLKTLSHYSGVLYLKIFGGCCAFTEYCKRVKQYSRQRKYHDQQGRPHLLFFFFEQP